MAAAATMAVAAATITASGSSAFYAYVAAMAVMHYVSAAVTFDVAARTAVAANSG